MKQTVSPMGVLVSIVERGEGTRIMEYYRKYKIIHHMQMAGRGTAASHLLDTLGFGTAERDVIISTAPRDTIGQLMGGLKDEDRSSLRVKGIAFSFNLSGMTAILAVGLSLLEEMEPERGDVIMKEGNPHSLILVSMNQGYTDEVMDAARGAGARGGTVLRARWTGAEAVEKFMGISLQTEKEVLAIVCAEREKKAIMEAVEEKYGLRADAQATVISLPIEHTTRLD